MVFVSLWYLHSHKQTAVTHSYILKGSQRALSSFHWFRGECWEASNVERNLLSFLFFYVLHNLKSYPLFLLSQVSSIFPVWCTFTCIGSIISQILPPYSIHHSFFFSRIDIFSYTPIFFNIFTNFWGFSLQFSLSSSTLSSSWNWKHLKQIVLLSNIFLGSSIL